MDSDKRTFIDPKTGEEIESTPEARSGARAFTLGFLTYGLVSGLGGCFFIRFRTEIALGDTRFAGWYAGGGVGLLVAGATAAVLSVLDLVSSDVRVGRVGGGVHDAIARWQHRRRKRKLEGGPDRGRRRTPPPG